MQIVKYVEGTKLLKGDNASKAGQVDAENVKAIFEDYETFIKKGDERFKKYMDKLQFQIVPFSQVPRPDLLDADSDLSSSESDDEAA